jgi:hypothetical protein
MGSIRVGWAGKPDLGALDCDVHKKLDNVFVSQPDYVVSWAGGKRAWAIWSCSEQRYVFSKGRV